MKSLLRCFSGASIASVLVVLASGGLSARMVSAGEGDGIPRSETPAADFCGDLFVNSPFLQRAFKKVVGRYPRFELPTYGQEFPSRVAPYSWIKGFTLDSALKLDQDVIVVPISGAILRGQSRPDDFYSNSGTIRDPNTPGDPLARLTNPAPAHAQAREGLFEAALEADTDSNPFDHGVYRFKHTISEFLEKIAVSGFNRDVAESSLNAIAKHSLQQEVLKHLVAQRLGKEAETAFAKRVFASLVGDDTWFGPANVHKLKQFRALAHDTGGLAHEKTAFLKALDDAFRSIYRSGASGQFQTSLLSRIRLSSFIDLEVQTWWNVKFELDEQGEVFIDSETGLTDYDLSPSPRKSSLLVRVLPSYNMRVDRWQELVDAIFDSFARAIHR